MAQDNPLGRRAEAPITRPNRHPKQPPPFGDRSSDDDPEESGSDNDDTVSGTSRFGGDMSDFPTIPETPLLLVTLSIYRCNLVYNVVTRP